jgi:hypothetical protein
MLAWTGSACAACRWVELLLVARAQLMLQKTA